MQHTKRKFKLNWDKVITWVCGLVVLGYFFQDLRQYKAGLAAISFLYNLLFMPVIYSLLLRNYFEKNPDYREPMRVALKKEWLEGILFIATNTCLAILDIRFLYASILGNVLFFCLLWIYHWARTRNQ